jgi:predicted amidohydrolase
MRVVCAQIEVVGGDLAGNVDRATAAIEAATADDADLVVLPELFTVGYFSIDSFVRRAESLAGPTLTRLAETAASQGVALLAGTFVEDLAATAAETEAPVPEADGLANTAVLFDAAGERRAVSRRLDLPGYGTGSGGPDTGSPGIATLRFGGESVTVGLTTGADLWLPGIYRDLADRGCELVCVPAAWVPPRRTVGGPRSCPGHRERLLSRGGQRLGRVRGGDAPRAVDGVRSAGNTALERRRRPRAGPCDTGPGERRPSS